MNEPIINQHIHKSLKSVLSQTALGNSFEQAQLNNALHLLSKWRSILIQNMLLQQQGTVVLQDHLQAWTSCPNLLTE